MQLFYTRFLYILPLDKNKILICSKYNYTAKQIISPLGIFASKPKQLFLYLLKKQTTL